MSHVDPSVENVYPEDVINDSEEIVEENQCALCEGTGLVQNHTLDNDSHEWVLDGTKPCECQIDDADFTGATNGDR